MNNAQKTYSIFADLLKKRGITPYRVYKETGVPQSSLSEWKRGNSIPKVDKMQKIAEYFGVSIDYLMGNGRSEQDIKVETFDDFTYAMHNESGRLSDGDKEILINLAKQMAKRRSETDSDSGK